MHFNPFTLLLPLLGGLDRDGAGGVLANPLPEEFSQQQQHPLDPHSNGTAPWPRGVSVPFFASLERLARLVDVTYCVGTTGVSPPFSCASRCKDFPSLHLERTWNTGVLLSDSCGYIAVDDGEDAGGKQGGGGPRHGHGPAIIVAFRGTYSITNTIMDLSTIPQEYVPYPAPGDGDGDGDVGGGGGGGGGPKCANCTVHMGFMASWRSAREVVLPALRAAREKHPGYPVHLVGHSLGGAVAALAALELRLSLGLTDLTVTTFGEPRIGNRELADYLDAAFGLKEKKDGSAEDAEKLPYRRVTHAGDPVPLLPLSEWGFRSHAGEVFIAKADLQPAPEDLRMCRGDNDVDCMGGAESGDGSSWLTWAVGLMRGDESEEDVNEWTARLGGIPARYKLWQLFFAHRDYFWRLGLCVPGGDPADWGRGRYNVSWDAVDDL